jgi:tripartite-type tricarboxylate transporter receptor subunit TctC
LTVFGLRLITPAVEIAFNKKSSMIRHRFVPCLLALFGSCVAAEEYPARPIRLVVPYPAGGAVDIVSRLVGQHIAADLGQQVVVDNRSGANGNIAVNPSIYRKMPFDTQKDLQPLSLVGTATLVMVVSPSFKARTVADFIAIARSRPGSIDFASSGTGSTSQLCSEWLKSMAGIDMVHVPYKGAAPALNDVIGGQVPMIITGVSSTLPHVKAGKLRALGVTSPRRLPALPDVPTIGETVPGYQVLSWYGLFLPKGVPGGVQKQLQTAVVSAVKATDTQERMKALGVEAESNTPAEFAALIRDEIAKWAKVVRSAGIRQQ